MLKKTLIVIVVLLAIILVGIAARYFYKSPDSDSASNTEALFAATFPDAEGQQQAMSQWRGKTLVVNFWATWCPPCREEMPELSKLHEQYRDQNLVVVGISTETPEPIRNFIKTMPVSYPLLAGDFAAMDIGASLGNDKGVLPYTVIISADGHIAKSYFGRVDQALLEQTLVPLLAISN
jgi:peroxiredoxin